ncbi:MAG: glycosyltransferase family 4 protein [Phycisphaerales bacterium]
MQRRRIAHIVPFADRIGGYERQARLVIRAQAARGYDLRVVTHAECVPAARTLFPDAELFGVSHRYGRFRHSDLATAVTGVEIVHAHALDPLTGAVTAAARSVSAPVVVLIASPEDVVHVAEARTRREDDDHRVSPSARVHRHLLRRSLRRAWRSARRAEGFIALNQAIAAALAGRGVPPDRIALLPNGVDIPEKSLANPASTDQAVFVGRLIPSKRVDLAIEAFRSVGRDFEDASLVIVGDGPERNRLEAAARDLSRVEFAGECADPSAYLRTAGLFVFPSVSEGCPNAVLEAAATRLPILATRIPGVVDWFRDGIDATLVEPGQIDAFAAAWRLLLADAARRRSLGTAARERVTAIASLPRIVERLDQIYDEAAGRMPARSHRVAR